MESIKKTKIYEDIIEKILGLISDGTLKPGDKLPSERLLATQMQVSRPALREALRAMQSMGYLTSTTGGGNYVREITMGNLMTPFSVMFSGDEKLMGELVSVRLLLEVEVVALAAKRINDKYAQRLLTTVDNMKIQIENGENGLEADNDFHGLLAEIADNGAISTILEMCRELMVKTRLATLNIPGQPIKTYEDHNLIAQAVISGSVADAKKYMRLHLQKAKKNLDNLALQNAIINKIKDVK